MKFFYDTEFHEYFRKPLFGKKRHVIDLISIGIVSEDGREYYAVCKEFDIKAAWNSWQHRKGQGDRNNYEPREYWLRENVLFPIWKGLLAKRSTYEMTYHYDMSEPFSLRTLEYLIDTYGKTREQIKNDLIEFVWPNAFKIKNDRIHEFPHWPFDLYGYYSAYDHVVLCSLFGKMIDLPKGFPMYTRDLKQMIDECAENMSMEPYIKAAEQSGIPKNIAKYRDISFEERLKMIKRAPGYPVNPAEHNALADAQWNKDLYDFLKKL